MQTIARRLPRALARIAELLGTIRRDQSGMSVVEFAISLPIVATLSMYGMEIAFMATTNMQVSQLALAVADNASRLGQTDNSAVTPTVSEASIDELMGGAEQQGSSLDFAENGRIILSSLELSDDGRQFIHWQRCRGGLEGQESAYGEQGDGFTGAVLPGMGKTGQVVTAGDNRAVMYAEVFYEYQPLFGDLFVKDMIFKQEGAFVVRDDRNLGGDPPSDGLTGEVLNAC